MAKISTAQIKELREMTGAGIMDSKRALESADGDIKTAAQALLEKGLASAAKRAGREAGEGVIEAYIHTGSRVGSLVELNCETDFVARTPEFKALARDLAMQVAAMSPRYVDRNSIPGDAGDVSEDEILLDQMYIRDTSVKVADLVTELISKVGENVKVGRIESRILLKLSGESFKGGKNFGIDYQTVRYIAGEIKQVHDAGVGIGVVVGGGNMWRGTDYEAQGMDRSSADHAGMLATVMNALVLHDQLERDGMPVRTMTAIPMPTVAEPYVRSRALHHLERGRTVIFAAGTGNPFMSTDTAASLRALEMNAGVLVMAKNGVDGVYDADPATVPTAKKFDHITHHKRWNSAYVPSTRPRCRWQWTTRCRSSCLICSNLAI
ncbi:Uridylate kinase [Geodia barretti]|uniref:Elongation factor Ts, mitochondrial n=1 Tax=Geodia barretti TaxID=519541 RepID=A0AA35RLR4_GEOBA|nr:Uridylate kinase [Geodia barretti]